MTYVVYMYSISKGGPDINVYSLLVKFTGSLHGS